MNALPSLFSAVSEAAALMNDSGYDLVTTNYQHVVLEGSSYEVGKALGEIIKRDPKAKQASSSATLDLKRLGFASWEALQDSCEACCPGITEEIQGFADALMTSPDKVPFWNWTYSPMLGGNCSQLAVLSSATEDGHVYAARSYEWNHHDEDLKLFTTRIRGKARHLGFSCLLFGRHDGMNEHGLVISMTGGGIFRVPFQQRGPMFWLVIRSLLDHCSSVPNALARLEDMPMAGYFSLMLVDKQDELAIMEVADGKRSIQRITGQDPKPYGFSVNHYRQPATQTFNRLNCGIIGHSRVRQTLITRWLDAHAPTIRKSSLRALFAAQHPEGLCNHFYNDGFGTLWSMVFDVTKGAVDVCFGAPTHNEYRMVGLADCPGVTAHPTVIPITCSRL
jgi:predicted choloylglycine hydrolase